MCVFFTTDRVCISPLTGSHQSQRNPRHQGRSAQRAGAPERGGATGRSGALLSTVTGGSGNFGLDLYRVYCVALCKEIGCAALSQLAMD
jgi:hypothetical protein